MRKNLIFTDFAFCLPDFFPHLPPFVNLNQKERKRRLILKKYREEWREEGREEVGKENPNLIAKFHVAVTNERKKRLEF